MPRTVRLDYPGGVFHFISRFVGNKFFMRDRHDRAQYLRLVGEALNATDLEVLA